MAFETKSATPLDRVMADLEQQIADLERQRRWIEAHPGAAPATAESRTGLIKRYLKEMLTPPASRPAPPVRRDLFDVPAEPLKDLEPAPIAFANQSGADLFTRAGGDTHQQKLGRYLSTGTGKTYRPLKHVQRRNRKQFILWVSLSIVAVVLLWSVVR
jgi:hypothetical protein